MPTFEAKTKDEMQGIKPLAPGEAPPSADPDFLRPLAANESWPRRWEFRATQHTLAEVLAPGYFHDETRDLLRLGDEIHIVAEGDGDVPSKWGRCIAVVEETPSLKEQPLIVVPVSY